MFSTSVVFFIAVFQILVEQVVFLLRAPLQLSAGHRADAQQPLLQQYCKFPAMLDMAVFVTF